MRIAHVVRQYVPSVGGLEEVVRNLVSQQRQAGLSPYVITLNRVFNQPDRLLPAHEVIEGVEVFRIPYVGSNRYPLAWSVLRYLNTADLVHVHAIDFFYDFLAITRLWHGKPMVVSTHGGFFHTPFASGLKKLYFNTVTRLSAMAYRKVIGCSDHDGQLFSAIVRPPQLQVIENGVDIAKFQLAGAKTCQPVIIYFGRLSSNKGLYEAIDVLVALKQASMVPWRMIICGRPYDLTLQDLQHYAELHGIQDRIQLLAHPSNTALLGLIGQASYYLCLSKHEGFGIAPIEAMSAGLYPLLSDIPPFAKLVRQTHVGVAFTTQDALAQAQQILRLHDSQKVQPAAIAAAVKPYAWQQVAQTYLQAYQQALSHSGDGQ